MKLFSPVSRSRMSRWRIVAMAVALAMATMTGLAQAANGDTPRYKFALITHAQPGDTFFDIMRKGATTAADKDNVQFVYLRGKSPDKQAAKLQNVINQNIDGIAITLAFPDAMKSLVKEAIDKGIPVVAVNSGFNDWKDMGVPMYVGQDEILAGNAVGKRLSNEGAKSVLCINQQQGAVQLEARCQGVADTFGGKAQTLYLEGYDMSKARSRIMAKLMQDSSIDAVVTLGAPFAPVAVDAVKMANSQAKVVTFDLNPRTAKLIQDGKVAWAVDQQPYLQGYEAIDLLWLNKHNGNTLGGGNAVLTGPSFVTSDNIDQILEYVERGTR